MKRSGALLLVLAMVLCFSACNGVYSVSIEEYADASKYSAGDAEFSASSVKAIKVDYAGDVTVVTGAADMVKVSEKCTKDLEDKYRLHTYLDDDGVLYVKFAESGAKFEKELVNWHEDFPKSLTISVPEELALSEFEFDIAAGNTEIEVGECKKVDIDAAAGNVKFYGADVDEFDLDMAAGNCSAGFGVAPSNSDFDLAAGDLDIILPSDAGVTLTIDKAVGSFDYDFPFEKSGNKYVAGDGGCLMAIDMAAGDVSIKGAVPKEG